MVTVRSVIALVAAQKWHIHKMDVYNAFLQRDLQEEVYMELPKGFNVLAIDGQASSVCKLLKSLHGVKQASRQ